MKEKNSLSNLPTEFGDEAPIFQPISPIKSLRVARKVW